jgi:hypothetical protein
MREFWYNQHVEASKNACSRDTLVIVVSNSKSTMDKQAEQPLLELPSFLEQEFDPRLEPMDWDQNSQQPWNYTLAHFDNISEPFPFLKHRHRQQTRIVMRRHFSKQNRAEANRVLRRQLTNIARLKAHGRDHNRIIRGWDIMHRDLPELFKLSYAHPRNITMAEIAKFRKLQLKEYLEAKSDTTEPDRKDQIGCLIFSESAVTFEASKFGYLEGSYDAMIKILSFLNPLEVMHLGVCCHALLHYTHADSVWMELTSRNTVPVEPQPEPEHTPDTEPDAPAQADDAQETNEVRLPVVEPLIYRRFPMYKYDENMGPEIQLGRDTVVGDRNNTPPVTFFMQPFLPDLPGLPVFYSPVIGDSIFSAYYHHKAQVHAMRSWYFAAIVPYRRLRHQANLISCFYCGKTEDKHTKRGLEAFLGCDRCGCYACLDHAKWHPTLANGACVCLYPEHVESTLSLRSCQQRFCAACAKKACIVLTKWVEFACEWYEGDQRVSLKWEQLHQIAANNKHTMYKADFTTCPNCMSHLPQLARPSSGPQSGPIRNLRCDPERTFESMMTICRKCFIVDIAEMQDRLPAEPDIDDNSDSVPELEEVDAMLID